MDQPMRRYYAVGDYVVGKQIGAGSFSTVWHARHRVHGTEVAIKEIATARLNSKLQESLKSEIFILKRINHPHIIRLHDMIEEPGKIYIVLEYCKGGDLSMYIQQRQGKVSEATAKHFMQQLAEGLKILRDNNLIHRDLKPQNLLLSTNGDNSTLKIADFGFARSLQPRGLAETLCGSPLYMAPEIMQLQKYDAKADLWSVGAILFQLVTGKTPFTGCNQIQLLQNIIKSNDLPFPPEAKDLNPYCIDLCTKLLRRNPVERLTFEEFFNHPYLSNTQPIDSFSNRQSRRDLDDFPGRNTEESSQEDCLPFSLDDDSSVPVGSPSPKRSTMRSMYGFSLDSKFEQRDYLNLATRAGSSKNNSGPCKTRITSSNLGSRQLSEGNLKESLKRNDLGTLEGHPRVIDSLESIDQDYVIVSGPPLDLSSSGGRASKQGHFPSKTADQPLASGKMKKTSSPMSIGGGATGRVDDTGNLGSAISAPRSSQGSMDMEQPSSDCMTRIKSLQCCASSITELVNEKADGGKQLEAFSIQLVILAIWKQALDICHTYAASASEGSSSQEATRLTEVSNLRHSPDAQDCLDIANNLEPHDISSLIERAFLHEVGNAEELAKMIEPGNMEMPDAMELIYQSALALGRRGAVDEYMGDIGNAVVFYSKAARLLQFILVEAPCLILNPPFSLTSSDRYRIKNYVDVLNNRQIISQSQRMALFKAADDGRPCPS
ncbi:serine/threonine-protein kinase ATG1c-like isoform X1 [Salvia splendens]|uniref:serine/threonine-protein kinase ATG1c-like isoform X1 n=1 Tax=Salvia splendens TaxID=180675 RepID=UPI001C278E15|nr:serine/threonine-protein kinase ATG1c-like isoform X1 [Salvia splendens]